MSPVKICESPPEIVFTRLNRTGINIDEQLRDAVLNRRLAFGSTNRQRPCRPISTWYAPASDPTGNWTVSASKP
jgi:hypothetical protein